MIADELKILFDDLKNDITLLRAEISLINYDVTKIREQLDKIEYEIKNSSEPLDNNTNNWTIEKL